MNNDTFSTTVFADAFKGNLITNLMAEINTAFRDAREISEDEYPEFDHILQEHFDNFEKYIKLKMSEITAESNQFISKIFDKLKEDYYEQQDLQAEENFDILKGEL